MFPTQSNTQIGARTFICGSDFSSKDGYLAVLSSNSAVPTLSLPSAIGQIPQYLVVDGNTSGKLVTAQPLSPNENIRIVAKGTGTAGAKLVVADPGTAADAGKVRAAPATAGVYVQIGIAEEDFVDGQLVLTRPDLQILNVVSADTLTALTFTSGGATGPEVAALRTAIKTILEAQGLMA